MLRRYKVRVGIRLLLILLEFFKARLMSESLSHHHHLLTRLFWLKLRSQSKRKVLALIHYVLYHILRLHPILRILPINLLLQPSQPIHLLTIAIISGGDGRPLEGDLGGDHGLEVGEGDLLVGVEGVVGGEVGLGEVGALLLRRPIRYTTLIVGTIGGRNLWLPFRPAILFVLFIHKLLFQLIQLISDFQLLFHLLIQPRLFLFGFTSLLLLHLAEQSVLVIVLVGFFLIEFVFGDVLEEVAGFHVALLFSGGGVGTCLEACLHGLGGVEGLGWLSETLLLELVLRHLVHPTTLHLRRKSHMLRHNIPLPIPLRTATTHIPPILIELVELHQVFVVFL